MSRLFLLLMTAGCVFASDATGIWAGTLKAPDRDGQAYLILVQHGEKLTGSAGPNSTEQHPISNGKAGEDGTITFEVNDGSAAMKFSLKQTGDEIKGTLIRDNDGGQQTAELTVKKNNSH